eukprot:5616804-Amphidinium_carterae.1
MYRRDWTSSKHRMAASDVAALSAGQKGRAAHALDHDTLLSTKICFYLSTFRHRTTLRQKSVS